MAKNIIKKDELKELGSFINSLIENNGGHIKDEWLKLLKLQGYNYKKNAKKVVKADKEPEDYNDFSMMIQKCLLENPPETESLLQEKIAFYSVNLLKLAEMELSSKYEEVNRGWYENGKWIVLKRMLDKKWNIKFDLDGNGDVLQITLNENK